MTKCVLEVVSMRGTICHMFYIQILVVAAARSTVVDTGMEGSTDVVVVVDTDGIVVVVVRSTFDVAVGVEFDDGVCDEEEDVAADADEEDTKDIPDLRFVAVESFVENYSLRVDMSHTSLHMDSSSISCFFLHSLSLSKTSNVTRFRK